MKPKTLISWLALIIIVAAFAYFISQNIEGFKQLSLANPYLIAIIALLHIIFLMNNGLMLLLFMKPFKINLSPRQWFGLSAITSFGNYFIPGIGGATSRAIYLKRNYNFPYSRFLGNLAGNYILVFFVNSLVALAALLLAKIFLGFWNWIIFGIFALIFLVSLTFILFHIPPFKSKYLRRMNKVVEGWEFVRRSKRLIAGTILIGFMNIIVYTFLVFVEYKIFGFDIGFLAALIVAVTSMLSIFINITPAGLGIRESLIVLTSVAFTIPSEMAVSIALIDRAINIVIVFIFGSSFSYTLTRRKRK